MNAPLGSTGTGAPLITRVPSPVPIEPNRNVESTGGSRWPRAGYCTRTASGPVTGAIGGRLPGVMSAARIRVVCILDTQLPQASAELQEVLDNLHAAAAMTNVKHMRGIPYGLNDPFGRA